MLNYIQKNQPKLALAKKMAVTIALCFTLLSSGLPLTAQTVNDVALSSIVCPSGIYMTDDLLQYPYVVIDNPGTNTINSVWVSYRIDDGDVVTRHVSPIILNHGETRNVLFSQITLPEGIHQFTAWVELDEGINDENTENNQMSVEFVVAGGDLSVQNIMEPTGDYCTFENITPQVYVKNQGDYDIGSFNIVLKVNEVVMETINWSGSIAPGDSVLVVFEEFNPGSGEFTFNFSADLPNGSPDYNMLNNEVESVIDFTSGNMIKIIVKANQSGDDITWNLYDSFYNEIAAGGPYSSNEYNEYFFCLEAGCYSFVMYDQGGNGICNGMSPGYYSIVNETSGETIVTNCDFDYQVTENFCLLSPYGPPVAGFNYTNQTSCSGYTEFIDISTSASEIVSYAWDFGDGTYSTEQNPIHIYSINGYHTVSLTVTNQYGSNTYTCSYCIVIDIPVGPTVSNGFSCGAGSITLEASSGNNSINWFSGPQETESFYTGESLWLPNLSQTTTYYVEAISESPHYFFGLYDNTGVGGYFGWNITRTLMFDAVSDVTIVSAKVYAQGAGNRTFTLYDSGNQMLDQKTINIAAGESRINLGFQMPQANGYYIAVSQQNNLAYTGDYNGPSFDYPYVVDGLLSLIGNNYSDSFYYFLYDIEVHPGLTDACISERVPVTAFVQYPNPGLPATSICCTGFECEINAADGYNEYFWSTSDQTQSIVVSSEGAYSVTVTDEFGCTASATTTSQFNDAGTISIESHVASGSTSANGWAVVSITGGTAPFQYIWSNGQTTATASGLLPGDYSVSVIDAAGCIVTGETSIEVNINDFNLGKDFIVYPNPVNNIVYVQAGCDAISLIKFYDLTGKTLLEISPSGSTTEIELSNYKSGIYFIKLLENNNWHTVKLIKQ